MIVATPVVVTLSLKHWLLSQLCTGAVAESNAQLRVDSSHNRLIDRR